MRRYTPTYLVNWYHDHENEDSDGYNLTALCNDCAQISADVEWASADDGTTDRCHGCGCEQDTTD